MKTTTVRRTFEGQVEALDEEHAEEVAIDRALARVGYRASRIRASVRHSHGNRWDSRVSFLVTR